ncbi:MAG: phosphoribosyltransferase family protein [Acidimicrobiales bacterium]
MEFHDRYEAGRCLGEQLVGEGHFQSGTVVLGLLRGGIPVAAVVAELLGAPLDVVVVRKLGVPFQPELAMGAVGEDGVLVLDREVLRAAGLDDRDLVAVEERERAEVERQSARVRSTRPPVPLAGKTAVVVDDGAATGSTARAACEVVRARGASRVVLAVPVGSQSAVRSLAEVADEVVCLELPQPFVAVGQCYEDFTQVTDTEVGALLERAHAQLPVVVPVRNDDPSVRDEDVGLTAAGVRLEGRLTVPERCSGLVVVAYGSSGSRFGPRSRTAAGLLNTAGFGTLLVDLLTPEEMSDRSAVFAVAPLAERLEAVTTWLIGQPEAAGQRVGFFGAGTGAAAALWAAAEPTTPVAAVVSGGGRPDLAGQRLGDVRAPTLFVAGGEDAVALALSRHAQRQMSGRNHLAIVAGATQLFEEPGALEEVAELARAWFVDYLEPTTAARTGQR